MCIEKGRGVKIASKDKVVYKVVKEYRGKLYLIFRDCKGNMGEIRNKERNVQYDFDFKETIKNKAIGFEFEYGFNCFLTESRAVTYLATLATTCLTRSKSSLTFLGILNSLPGGIKFKIVKCIIPKGTRYECGAIKKNLIGGGLPSVRAEKLRIVE